MKHFDISWDGHVYKFGMAEFTSIQHFVEHFENRPLLAADSGTQLSVTNLEGLRLSVIWFSLEIIVMCSVWLLQAC